jgi:hypothetical protein
MVPKTAVPLREADQITQHRQNWLHHIPFISHRSELKDQKTGTLTIKESVKNVSRKKVAVKMTLIGEFCVARKYRQGPPG